jgi:hypothetical protein
MMRFGTDESGFSIETSPLGARVLAWGFWDAAIAVAFPAAVLDALGARGGQQLLVDATQLKPQGDDGQAAFRRLVEATSKLKLRAEVVVTNAITKLQLVRILREVGSGNWTTSNATSAAFAKGGV